MSASLINRINIVPAIIPIDLATGANNGDWVGFAEYNRCLVVLLTDVGTAGEDPIFNLQQASDNAGTGAKDLLFTNIYEKEGATALNAIATFTLVTQTAATSYTSATGGENEQLICVDVHANDLDVEGGFTHLRLDVADTGGTAGKLGAALYVMYDPRHLQESNLTAIA